MRTTTIACFGLASLFALGCNTTTEGANGLIAFTPDNCSTEDLRGCDFADSLGVGGQAYVTIMGIDDYPTAGIDLASDDESVLFVEPAPDFGGRPTWQITGQDEGVARIAALDPDGNEVDFVEVGVQFLSGLALEDFIGDAVGPDLLDPEFDEVWTINANEQVSFYVNPLIGDGVPTMGRYQYDAILDEPIALGGTVNQDPAGGYLDFQVPAGEYAVTFENLYQDGLVLNVLFVAQ
jgi:hypothetical protein